MLPLNWDYVDRIQQLETLASVNGHLIAEDGLLSMMMPDGGVKRFSKQHIPGMTNYRISSKVLTCQRINTERLLLLWWRKYLRVKLMASKKEHHILAYQVVRIARH